MELFIADIQEYAAHEARLLPRLSGERQRRALAVPTEEKRLQQLCAGLLLDRLAAGRPVCRGERGKPFLPGGPEFSLSHGGTLAVLAVSPAAVGADVERPRPVRDSVSRRCFCPEEQAWLDGTGAEGFFALWTRKEAVLKACGRGLSLPMRAFSVLEEQTAAEGRSYFLHTRHLRGHILSVASAEAAEFPEPVFLHPDDFL